MTVLVESLSGSPYQGYTYAYPHKTAYRLLEDPVPLAEAWAGERREALFLYLHVPFCEMRCGFCNLFTQAQPENDFVDQYLRALQTQARRVRTALSEVRFARCAIGGGTPTQLTPRRLEAMFDVATAMGADLQAIPVSMEASPETVTPEKLALLTRRGVKRLSLGVQTFVEAEVRAVGRPQRTAQVVHALETIRQAGFAILNVDLIYGLPGQTLASWLTSLRHALRFRPEEIYLYPLYSRPLTGLGRSERSWDDVRLECYRAGRELLLAEGYRQVSMRMFQAGDAPLEDGPVYCCQEDGMVGLGCGARSYTRDLHYSCEYAVGAVGVREILADYVARPAEAYDVADYGFHLDDDERRRRHVLQSLLQCRGLDRAAYLSGFGTDVLDDLPQLATLADLALATIDRHCLQLTPAGLERSDAIGPWLYSDVVRGRMEAYEWR